MDCLYPGLGERLVEETTVAIASAVLSEDFGHPARVPEAP